MLCIAYICKCLPDNAKPIQIYYKHFTINQYTNIQTNTNEYTYKIFQKKKKKKKEIVNLGLLLDAAMCSV